MTEGSKRSLAELIEERDRNNGVITSVIYWGDNLNVLPKLPLNSVDLIYLDPPFSPDPKYWFIWGDKDKEEDEAVIKAYEEACSGREETYTEWMHARVRLMHDVLKEDGSFYFHCDEQMNHYFKKMLHGVFGPNNFRREITWEVGWVSGFKSTAKNWIRNHEIIYFYTKSKNYKFHKIYVPHPPGYKRRGGGENPLGVPLGDVWTDIPSIQHLSYSKEKTGYATQKPVTLLERIIKTSSNEGDIVLDPFCGCGTTPVAAYNLNRKYIGIDLAEKGCETSEGRLAERDAPYCVIPWDYFWQRQVRKLEKLSGNKFQNWVLLRIKGKRRRSADRGIDLYTNRGEPVQVKKIHTRVGPAVLRDFNTALGKTTIGYIVSFYGFTKQAIDEADRYRAEGGPDIQLVTLNSIDKLI